MITHKRLLRFMIIVAAGIALFPFLPPASPAAADGTVTDCTNDAQLTALLPQGGTIFFNCGGAYTITLSSQKVITTSVWIEGANNGFPLVLSGNNGHRIFSINSGVTVYLFDLTITNGRALVNNGGDILNAGTLYLTDVTVSHGQATANLHGLGGKGGGISNSGILYINHSTISANVASDPVNSVNADGGGIYSTGQVSITNSTLSGNSADNTGGGLFSSGAASSLLNVTLANNVALADGGNLNAGGSLWLKNTLLAGGAPNCSATSSFTSLGHNLSDDGSCASLTASGDLNSTAANLGGLATNGGQTLTHLPLPGSAAINNGSNADCPFDDQRHFARPQPQGGACDVGSVEVVMPATITSRLPISRAAGTAGFNLQVNGGTFVPGVTVLWNGSALSTVLNSPGIVTAFVPAGELNTVGAATISVQNPGVAPSNGLSFSVFDAGDLVTDCSEYGLDAALFNGGTITFNCGNIGSPATITLSAQKVINSNTTIDGGNKVTLSGGGTIGIFSVMAATHFGLANLTVSGGASLDSCFYGGGQGGAISNQGTVDATNVSFTNNIACNGGAIWNGGALSILGSHFNQNMATSSPGLRYYLGYGGAIDNHGTAAITSSVFVSNTSDNENGGAINNGLYMTVTNSQFTDNAAGTYANGIAGGGGGGISNDGSLLVTGSTFTDNRAPFYGGGIDNEAGAIIVNSTFISNSAATLGGGIHNGGNAMLELLASRILSNTSSSGGGLNNYGTEIVGSSFFTRNMASLGGGINNQGTLSLTASTLAGNSASAAGGAINNDQSLLLVGGTIVSNTAQSGGGISNRNTLTISASTLTTNVAGTGAGVVNSGTLTVYSSTFNLNSASSNGGAIENAGVLSVTNSTISTNSSAAFGGGIDSSNSQTQTSTILNSTLISNTAGLGGGNLYRNGGLFFLKNTIVAYGTLQNCAANVGNFTTLGHNLDTGTSCDFTAVSDLNNADPKLGPLQNNGGPAPTHALLRGSPAIDAGDNAGCPATDQRSVQRPMDGNGDGVAVCDIGAYEANALLRLFLPLVRR